MDDRKLNGWANVAARLLYPWRCFLCHRLENTDIGICNQCLPCLPWCDCVCIVCGLPMEETRAEITPCGQCQKEKPSYDRLVAPLWYQPPVRQLIVDFKYSYRWDYGRLLIELFAQACRTSNQVPLLLPVPSHQARIRERGFNAVFELIRMLRKKMDIRFDLYALQRVSHTATQTGKSRRQRRKNVKNAFLIKKPIQQQKIILFDDVITTSATVNEISKYLKSQGVEYVEVWALARTRKLLSS